MSLTLTRTLVLTNPLLQGPDVVQVQKLLTAKGFHCTADGVFGQETGAACVEAKTALGYPLSKRKPTCGQALVNALQAHSDPFPPPPLSAPRLRFVSQLNTFLSQKANWDYAQVRPIPHPGHVGRVRTDCSGGVTYAAQCAGCPDPNGFGFNGQGYTGSLMNHCQQITRSMLLPGDLVIWGVFPGHHVAAVLNALSDPLLWSHGKQGDPQAVSLSVESAVQASLGHSTVYFFRWLP